MQRAARTRLFVLCACLAGCAFLAARRWVWPRLVDTRPLVNGEQVWDENAGLRWAVWGVPREIRASLSAPLDLGGAALSPDERWIVFAAGEPGARDLFLAEWIDGEARDAQPIAALNSDADECAPSFGAGALHFASNRSGGAGGFDLYCADWDGVGFTTGVEPWPSVNTAADELDPCFADERLLFASNREHDGRGDFELYEASLGGGARVERIAAASSALDERDPCAVPGRTSLWFARVDASTGRSWLWRSTGWAGDWLAAQSVQGLGAFATERAPELATDGLTLRFAATSEDGRVTLWEARTLELLRGPAAEGGWVELVTLALLALVALLAALAQRWNSLDPLYKCALGSLLLHLLLLLLLRYVHPEGEAWSTEKGASPRYRVRVDRPLFEARANSERGGAFELARESSQLAAPPERVDAEHRASTVATAPSAIERLELTQRDEAAAAPERRAESQLERSFEAASGARVELATPSESTARRTASMAPSPDVAARSVELESARSVARIETAGPSAVHVPRASHDAPRAADAPTTPRLERRSGADFVAAPARSREVEQELGQELERGVAPESDGPSIALPNEARSERSATSAAPSANLAPSPALASTPRRILEFAPPERESTPSSLDAAALGAPEVAPAQRAAIARRSVAADVVGPAARAPASESAPTAQRSVVGAGPDLAAPSESGSRRAVEASRSLDMLPLAATPLTLQRGVAEGPSAPERAPRERAGAQVRADPSAPEPLASMALTPAPSTAATPDRAPPRLDATPYRTRFGAEKSVALREHGGNEQTEHAVAAGLEYLARLQNGDGSWGRASDRNEKYRDVRVGKTGLALLAFLGAGHTPGGATQHARCAERAVDWLLGQQLRRGGQVGDGEAYGHGIATYALAECYALTREAPLLPAVTAAVDRILSEQIRSNDPRLNGGWSYYYADGAQFDRWPRASITAWQVMALESARLGGVEVPDAAFDAAREFLADAWDESLGRFRYNHDPRRLNSAYSTLPGSTPAAVFALSLLGEAVDSERWSTAIDFISACAPRGYRFVSEAAFVERAQGNLYFWYYGSLALLRHGGAAWERWNAALKDALLPAQADDGSWRPIDVYSEYAGDTDEQRIYSTAMCVLSLEVYYRYFTPLLRVR